MKTQNVFIIDYSGKSEKNQLKLPVYNNYENPVIIFEGQQTIGPFKTTSFPEKFNLLKSALKCVFTGKFMFTLPVFTKTTK